MGEPQGTLLDLRMPACPGTPAQQAFDVWPSYHFDDPKRAEAPT
jgi:hypothetical protein